LDSINLDALFISLFVFGWLLCSGLVWLILAAQRRGRAALATLPAALILGCLSALLLPILGFRDGRALALSFPLAALGAFVGTFAVLAAGAMMDSRVPTPRPSSTAPGESLAADPQDGKSPTIDAGNDKA
jgi:hypothetical protein